MNTEGMHEAVCGAVPETDREARLAAAVKDALAMPCPDRLDGRILGAVREQEHGVHAWQAPWLFALPVLELALLLVLRSEVAAFMGPAARFCAGVRDAATPAWVGCAEWLATRWRGVLDLLAAGSSLPADGLPWIAVALVAAMSAALILAGLERRHA